MRVQPSRKTTATNGPHRDSARTLVWKHGHSAVNPMAMFRSMLCDREAVSKDRVILVSPERALTDRFAQYRATRIICIRAVRIGYCLDSVLKFRVDQPLNRGCAACDSSLGERRGVACNHLDTHAPRNMAIGGVALEERFNGSQETERSECYDLRETRLEWISYTNIVKLLAHYSGDADLTSARPCVMDSRLVFLAQALQPRSLNRSEFRYSYGWRWLSGRVLSLARAFCSVDFWILRIA
ncbi:hypothetical protein BASA60_001597 [Batrachochytrium salamandrivorans]|nr:hypothetical protein BASA60_001597 [Batrachochytrium salamandrivorans]